MFAFLHVRDDSCIDSNGMVSDALETSMHRRFRNCFRCWKEAPFHRKVGDKMHARSEAKGEGRTKNPSPFCEGDDVIMQLDEGSACWHGL